MTSLDEIVERVQRRMSGYGTPPDKECIKAVLATLTERECAQLILWKDLV